MRAWPWTNRKLKEAKQSRAHRTEGMAGRPPLQLGQMDLQNTTQALQPFFKSVLIIFLLHCPLFIIRSLH